MSNLDQLLATARASVDETQIERRVRREIRAIFKEGLPDLGRVYFPANSAAIATAGVAQLVILAPAQALRGRGRQVSTAEYFIRSVPRKSGGSTLIWCVPESSAGFYSAGRKVLIWERVRLDLAKAASDEVAEARSINLKVLDARHEFREAVWQSYRMIFLTDCDGPARLVDLGMIYSSSAPTLARFIICELMEGGDLVSGICRKILASDLVGAIPMR